MKKQLAILILLALPAFASDEMRKLDFLVGEWKGEAVVQMGPGEPQRIVQTERVQSKMNGELLLIEGLGKRKLADGALGDVVHDAMAMLHWDAARKTYRFATYVAGRGGSDTTLDVTGPNQAVWGLDTPRGKMRYTISLTEKGEWLEIGEWSSDGGTKWVKFIEMRLQKVK